MQFISPQFFKYMNQFVYWFLGNCILCNHIYQFVYWFLRNCSFHCKSLSKSCNYMHESIGSGEQLYVSHLLPGLLWLYWTGNVARTIMLTDSPILEYYWPDIGLMTTAWQHYIRLILDWYWTVGLILDLKYKIGSTNVGLILDYYWTVAINICCWSPLFHTCAVLLIV